MYEPYACTYIVLEIITALIFISLPYSKCVYIVQVDPKGWVPKTIVNRVAADQASRISMPVFVGVL